MRTALFFIRTGMATLLLGGAAFHSGWAQPPMTRDGEKVDFARQLLNKSEYKLAASEFEEFIRQYPQSHFLAQAYLGAGDSYFFLNEYPKAIGFYQRYAQEFPNGQGMWFDQMRLGQCLFLTGNNDEALTKLTSVDISRVTVPFIQTLYFYLGQVFMARKNFQQAAANFKKATQAQTSGGYASQAYLQWGNVLARQAEYPQAIEKYLKAFNLADSDDVRKEAKVNWFTALLKSGQLDKLITCYHQQFKDHFQDPAFFPVHLSVADVFIKQNKNDEALGILDKLIAAANGLKGLDRGTKLAALLLKARALEGLKNYDASWESYSGAAREFPDEPAAYCGMARLRYIQDNFKEAASLFMDCFNKSKSGPSRQDMLFNAFLMYQKAGMNDKAITAAGFYRQQYPQGRWIFDVDLALAQIYTQGQKYDQAEKLLNPLLEKTDDPHWPQALFQMGYNLQLSGKTHEALSAYEKLDSSQNINPELRYFVFKNSAIIYLKDNDRDKAALALGWMARNSPPHELPLKDYLWLAQYWQSKNDPQKMLDVLNRAPKSSGQAAQIQGINFFMAEAYRLQKDCAQAQDHYNKIIAEQGSNPYQGRAYLGRGLCLASQGDKVNARKAFEKAIALNLDDNFVTMRARFELARLFESQQDLETAVKLYMMVGLLYQDPEYGPQALLRAGAILQKLNETQAARRAYQQILEDYPHSTGALKARELIGKVL